MIQLTRISNGWVLNVNLPKIQKSIYCKTLDECLAHIQDFKSTLDKHIVNGSDLSEIVDE